MRLVLLGALALAACGPSAEPAPGVVERFTTNIQRDEADTRADAGRIADVRAAGRAEDATQRIARSERERQAGDAAPGKQSER